MNSLDHKSQSLRWACKNFLLDFGICSELRTRIIKKKKKYHILSNKLKIHPHQAI